MTIDPRRLIRAIHGDFEIEASGLEAWQCVHECKGCGMPIVRHKDVKVLAGPFCTCECQQAFYDRGSVPLWAVLT